MVKGNFIGRPLRVAVIPTAFPNLITNFSEAANSRTSPGLSVPSAAGFASDFTFNQHWFSPICTFTCRFPVNGGAGEAVGDGDVVGVGDGEIPVVGESDGDSLSVAVSEGEPLKSGDGEAVRLAVGTGEVMTNWLVASSPLNQR